MAEDDGNSPGVEAGVDVVEDAAGHWDRELELVGGGDVGRHDGDDGACVDSEGSNGGSDFPAAGVGLGPSVSDVIEDDGRAVGVDVGCSLEECESGEWTRIRRVWFQLVHDNAGIGYSLSLDTVDIYTAQVLTSTS